MNKKLTSVENKFCESRLENEALIQKSDEIINKLQQELQIRDEKLAEHGKFNDLLNAKLEESNKMIEQLQSTIEKETIQKVDFQSVNKFRDKILELVTEKDSLTDKITLLETQLTDYRKNNNKLQADFNKIFNENEYLGKFIQMVKHEYDRLNSNISKNPDKTQVKSKIDEMLQKIKNHYPIKHHKKNSLCTSESSLRSVEKEAKSQKEKVCNTYSIRYLYL